jgi:hypothetical protein
MFYSINLILKIFINKNENVFFLYLIINLIAFFLNTSSSSLCYAVKFVLLGRRRL